MEEDVKFRAQSAKVRLTTHYFEVHGVGEPIRVPLVTIYQVLRSDPTEPTLKPNALHLCVRAHVPGVPFAQSVQHTLVSFKALRTADEWEQRVRRAAGLDVSGQQRVLVVLNPVSGRRRARDLYHRFVDPLLRAAGLRPAVVETTHRGHAASVAQTCDLSLYDVVACAGGDGVVHEVLNGLLTRPDWYAARLKPLAVLPCGSGNGLACSLNLGSPWDAAWALAKGHSCPLDIMSVWRGRPPAVRREYCFLSVTIAFIADVDIKSETFRFLGEPRFFLQTLIQIAKLPMYRARVSYLPDTSAPLERHSSAWRNPRCLPPNGLVVGRPRPIGADPAGTGTGSAAGGSSSSSSSTAVAADEEDRPWVAPTVEAVAVPTEFACTVTDPLPGDDWVVLEEDFLYFLVSNVPCLDSSTVAAPYACLSDGRVDLSWVTKAAGMDRIDAIKTFSKCETGDHVLDPRVKYAKVRALRLEPLCPTGILDVDGEQVPWEPLQLEVHRGLLNLVCPPISVGI